MPSTLNEMIQESVGKYGDLPALKIRRGEVFHPISYRELGRMIEELGTGLIDLGVKRGEHLGLIADNRYEWMICDLAILGTGACDVPRGCDATPQEIEFILRHAGIGTVFVENRSQLEKLYAIAENLPELKTFILMCDGESVDPARFRLITLHTMESLMERGKELLKNGDTRFRERGGRVGPDDLATIIYTSGTTGQPKGVMLTHRNIMHNVINAPKNVPITRGDRFVSFLPTWHSFERTVEYVLLHVGASNAYSKPAAQVLIKDFEAEKPHYVSSVPRIWEALYNAILYKISRESTIRRALFHFFVQIGIRHHRHRMTYKNLMPKFEPGRLFSRPAEIITSGAALLWLTPLRALGDRLVFSKIRERTGGELKAGISGGGALPSHIDEFFAGVGLCVLEGYGLTETSPIVAVRTFERPVPYTVGPLLRGVEVKIVDERGTPLSRGARGLIMVRGDLVMKGYYKDQKATKKVLDPDGWLNTGDLGRLALAGELQITGRAKDTIVLTGGDNIEPMPIEQKLTESRYVHQVIIIGQDRKTVGALIVPDFEALHEYAAQEGVAFREDRDLIESPAIRSLFRREIKELISPKNGFRAVEYVSSFRLLPRAFEVGKELTQTLKMKRNFISDIYREDIQALYR
jgi:long-chain acyl-CoA synthetase